MGSKKMEFWVCTVCGEPISGKGLLVHGNVYSVEEGTQTGGLVGNNFPEDVDMMSPWISIDIEMSAFHIHCLLKYLIGAVDVQIAEDESEIFVH